MPLSLVTGIFLILGLGLCLVKTNIARAGLADHLVINEIQVDGIAGTGGTDDDFIELFNPTGHEIALVNWSIQKTSASGATSSLTKLTINAVIPAGGYFLIVRDDASTTQMLKDLADLKSSSFSIANNNIIFLVNNDEKIMDTGDQNIEDFVGFGTVTYFEGAPESAIPEGKSIARVPDGEDTDNNAADFFVQNTPTPQNSQGGSGNGLDGTVLLTITPGPVPVQAIAANSAGIVFQVNGDGQAKVNFGLTDAYGSSTLPEAFLKNTDKTITLAGLQCGTAYHYSIYAENAGATETDETPDAVFTTMPCGIVINSLSMTKTAARANNQYADGWTWEFNITIWNFDETLLKMKFDQWNGAGILDSSANMQYSVDNGGVWHDITANGVYPAAGAGLDGIDNNIADAGRQVKILVRMKVPFGTGTGHYNSNFGILTE